MKIRPDITARESLRKLKCGQNERDNLRDGIPESITDAAENLIKPIPEGFDLETQENAIEFEIVNSIIKRTQDRFSPRKIKRG